MKTLLHYFRHFYFILLLFVFSENVNGQCTITGLSVSANSLTCGTSPLSGCNGVLYIGDGTVTSLKMDDNLDLTCLGPIQLIVNSNANIDFTIQNYDLLLAAGSSITFIGTGTLVPFSGNDCTSSDRIKIGGIAISNCMGTGGTVSFSDLVGHGGYNVVNVSPTSASVCGPGSFSFTATALPSTGATINWYSAATGGTLLMTGSTYAPSISTTTTYYVEAYYSSTGFSTPRKAVVATVNSLPDNIVSNGFTGGSFCPVSQATLTFDAVDTNGAPPYTLSYTDGTTTFSQNIPSNAATIFNVSATTSTGYTLESITNANGCVNTSPSNKTANVTFRPAPTASISGTTAVCQGGISPNITFTNPRAAGITITYTINGGTGQAVDVAANGYTTVPVPTTTAGSFVYSLTSVVYSTSPICTQTLSGSATVTINPLPTTPTITGAAMVCQGETNVGYSVSAIINATSYVWTYSGAGATITNGTTSTPTITFATNATSGNLTVYGVNACGNGVVSANYAITVNLLPTLTGAITGTITVCQGQTNVGYSIPVIVNAAAYNWVYSGAGGTITSGTTNNPTLAFANNATSGDLTVYGVDACGNQRVAANLFVTVQAPPSTPTLGATTQPDCITSTGSVVLSGLPATGFVNQTGTVINSYQITGSTMTIPSLAVGTYNFSVTNGGCPSLPTNNVDIIATTTAIWNGSVWANGPPTINQAVQFTGNYSSGGDLSACSCTVTSGNVVINSGHTLKITNWVHVNGGSLTFNDTASLVQINNVSNTNSGDIKYERLTTVIRNTDYTYWSSPVEGFTLGELSPDTLSDKFYSFDSGIEDWKQESAGTTMGSGIGYAVRGPQTSMYMPPYSPNPYQANFVGVPNNGHYEITGIFADKSYFLGNPYPSALDADTFLDTNQTVLDGTLYFWTHNTPIAIGTPNPGTGLYAYSGDDYASYNRTGGISTGEKAPSSVPPNTGANSNIPSGKIASGQGFFGGTKTVAAGFVVATPIVYNNLMRVGVGTITGTNNQFFKTKNTKSKTTTAIEKHRIWLDLTNSQGAFKQTLIGYVTDATNDYEGRFDGKSYDGNDFLDFYSILQDKNLAIQGRALPFDENDEVPLGYRVAFDGTFTIKIGQTDGILANQQVFIEDKLTNIVTDLKSGNYTFNTVAGTFNDRFVLRYTDETTSANKTLGLDEMNANDGIVVLYSNNYKTLIIRNNLKDATVNSITLFNMSGQKISTWDVKDREQTSIQIPIKNIRSEIYIVKVKTTKGETSQKIVIR